MWEWRSNHFAMYTNDRFYVFGGGPRRTEKQHLKELNLKYCGFDMGLFAGTKAGRESKLNGTSNRSNICVVDNNYIQKAFMKFCIVSLFFTQKNKGLPVCCVLNKEKHTNERETLVERKYSVNTLSSC